MLKNSKLFMVIAFGVLMSLILSGCSSSQQVQPTQEPTAQPTATPTVKPTIVPTATPEPIPEILSILNDYYSEHESTDEYQIKDNPRKEYADGAYSMSLVADEVPDSNGTAIVNAKSGSKTIEIDFQYSTFMGTKICSPSLIKAVSVATVKAIANMQKLDNVDELVKNVIASYDELKYTSIAFVGDYAFVFEPKNVYATVLNVINYKDFLKSFSNNEYENATYDDMIMQLNSGSKYAFNGRVKTYGSGQYKNSFAAYNCLMLEVEMESGQIINVVQFPEKVPISFEVGQNCIFYGTTMFDVSGNLLFYLHYAE